MAKPATESIRDVVLIGGGHAHVQVLRAFAMRPAPRTRLCVVLDDPIAIYSGMVPGYVAGQYERHELEIDVVPLARRAGARVILSPAEGIDSAARRVHVAGRPPIPFDLVSLDVGSSVVGLERPGVREHAIATRPIAALVRRVDALVRQAKTVRGAFRVVIVGAGAGGVELAFALRHRLAREGVAGAQVQLVDSGPRVLRGYASGLAERIAAEASRAGIEVCGGALVEAVRSDAIDLADGRALPFEALFWVTGAAPNRGFSSDSLPLDDRGFVRVRETLEVEGCPGLFAVGDCASLAGHDLPKAGVYAVREGPVLTANLRAALEGRPLRPYGPQRDFLTLLNLGDGRAVATKWGRSAVGTFAMRWKDWIDRRFMRRFQVLDAEGRVAPDIPQMAPMADILCGGCAAKVGQPVLERALARLDAPPEDASVVLGLDGADDASAVSTPGGDTIVSSLDAFSAFTDDPFLVGRVAALNALSDLYATGATPRHALALVALPEAAEPEDAEETLVQVLAGARRELDALGVTLVGGHTTTGARLQVGFSVDGLLPENAALLRLRGLKPGQALVLSKPLGTGVLFHADMQGRAAGRWLQAAIATMLRPNAAAARLARELGATAATDVTGYGLVGHLGEMLRASEVSAVVRADALPSLPGAVELFAQGLQSTFHAENERARRGLRVSAEAAADPRFPLLFDPQTSGGLIFGVPADRADEAVSRLRAEGDAGAARIGEVCPARPDGAPIEVVTGS